MLSNIETDETYARRLQAQEMGFSSVHSNPDAQTPLMVIDNVKLINYVCCMFYFNYSFYRIVTTKIRL
jgi:hypothetical protein